MAKKTWVRLIAVLLAFAMPALTAFTVYAQPEPEVWSDEIKYVSPDANDLSGMGQEPEDISVSAGAEYLEKAWYEYVMYSEKAVASYRLDDNTRILFYDPYTYTNSMVMDVQFDATTTEFDTMSSYTVSNTKAKTITDAVSSTDTKTTATQTSGKDYTFSKVTNSGDIKTTYNHKVAVETEGKVTNGTEYFYDKEEWETRSVTHSLKEESETEWLIGTPGVTQHIIIGGEQSNTTTDNVAWLTKKEEDYTIYSDGYKTTTKYTTDSTVTDETTSTTDGWTELAARVTITTGSESATSKYWSELESETVTKTYAATHFAADGITPLPWAIIHYEVQMPMKCCLQYKYSGEWITVSTAYCMLTTIKGTCRAWMQNGQVYYEDWGSGEPVVATDFWGQFLTKEQLMAAYSNKLYPVGGVD